MRVVIEAFRNGLRACITAFARMGMNDAASLARVSLAPHRLVRVQRRNLAADHLVTATASLGRH